MCFDIMGLKGATLSGFVESRQQVATASGYSTNILIRCQTITSTTTITRYSGRLLKLLMQILHQQLQHPHSWPTPRSAKHLSSSSLEELRIGFRRSQFSSVPAIQDGAANLLGRIPKQLLLIPGSSQKWKSLIFLYLCILSFFGTRFSGSFPRGEKSSIHRRTAPAWLAKCS